MVSLGAYSTISSEYIKAITGKFDLSTVFNLNFADKEITNASAIAICFNLVVLNLSKNSLSSISDFKTLSKLTILDISFNKLKNLDGIEGMIRLKTLKAQGNQIDQNLNIKNTFEKLKAISKIYLQDISGNNANPICKTQNYRENMYTYIQSLNILDGTNREFSLIESYKNCDFSTKNSLDVNKVEFDFLSKFKYKN